MLDAATIRSESRNRLEARSPVRFVTESLPVRRATDPRCHSRVSGPSLSDELGATCSLTLSPHAHGSGKRCAELRRCN
ncbi:MAG: hypothetical protein QOH61_1028 [Chloroflexota bacterium]|jgi:hypothetical protein|nr:hypothetical protein [Chloroflexota bacterium]